MRPRPGTIELVQNVDHTKRFTVQRNIRDRGTQMDGTERFAENKRAKRYLKEKID
jgi:hypothetical protein